MKGRTDKHNYISYEIIIKFVVVNIMLRTVNGRKFRSSGGGWLGGLEKRKVLKK